MSRKKAAKLVPLPHLLQQPPISYSVQRDPLPLDPAAQERERAAFIELREQVRRDAQPKPAPLPGPPIVLHYERPPFNPLRQPISDALDDVVRRICLALVRAAHDQQPALVPWLEAATRELVAGARFELTGDTDATAR